MIPLLKNIYGPPLSHVTIHVSGKKCKVKMKHNSTVLINQFINKLSFSILHLSLSPLFPEVPCDCDKPRVNGDNIAHIDKENSELFCNTCVR